MAPETPKIEYVPAGDLLRLSQEFLSALAGSNPALFRVFEEIIQNELVLRSLPGSDTLARLARLPRIPEASLRYFKLHIEMTMGNLLMKLTKDKAVCERFMRGEPGALEALVAIHLQTFSRLTGDGIKQFVQRMFSETEREYGKLYRERTAAAEGIAAIERTHGYTPNELPFNAGPFPPAEINTLTGSERFSTPRELFPSEISAETYAETQAYGTDSAFRAAALQAGLYKLTEIPRFAAITMVQRIRKETGDLVRFYRELYHPELMELYPLDREIGVSVAMADNPRRAVAVYSIAQRQTASERKPVRTAGDFCAEIFFAIAAHKRKLRISSSKQEVSDIAAACMPLSMKDFFEELYSLAADFPEISENCERLVGGDEDPEQTQKIMAQICDWLDEHETHDFLHSLCYSKEFREIIIEGRKGEDWTAHLLKKNRDSVQLRLRRAGSEQKIVVTWQPPSKRVPAYLHVELFENKKNKYRDTNIPIPRAEYTIAETSVGQYALEDKDHAIRDRLRNHIRLILASSPLWEGLSSACDFSPSTQRLFVEYCADTLYQLISFVYLQQVNDTPQRLSKHGWKGSVNFTAFHLGYVRRFLDTFTFRDFYDGPPGESTDRMHPGSLAAPLEFFPTLEKEEVNEAATAAALVMSGRKKKSEYKKLRTNKAFMHIPKGTPSPWSVLDIPYHRLAEITNPFELDGFYKALLASASSNQFESEIRALATADTSDINKRLYTSFCRNRIHDFSHKVQTPTAWKMLLTLGLKDLRELLRDPECADLREILERKLHSMIKRDCARMVLQCQEWKIPHDFRNFSYLIYLKYAADFILDTDCAENEYEQMIGVVMKSEYARHLQGTKWREVQCKAADNMTEEENMHHDKNKVPSMQREDLEQWQNRLRILKHIKMLQEMDGELDVKKRAHLGAEIESLYRERPEEIKQFLRALFLGEDESWYASHLRRAGCFRDGESPVAALWLELLGKQASFSHFRFTNFEIPAENNEYSRMLYADRFLKIFTELGVAQKIAGRTLPPELSERFVEQQLAALPDAPAIVREFLETKSAQLNRRELFQEGRDLLFDYRLMAPTNV